MRRSVEKYLRPLLTIENVGVELRADVRGEQRVALPGGGEHGLGEEMDHSLLLWVSNSL